MIVFPHAKINLGLHVLEKREDGYHNIETVFYPLKICDALEILPYAGKAPKFELTGHMELEADEDNLCMKAYRLLEKDHGLPPVQMHLHKNIPMGAGLGGGSSDAAHTLLLLNEIFGLGLKKDSLHRYAAMLGSDCAFFLENKPALGRGKGDELKDFDLDLSSYRLVLIMPDVHISTQEAYAGIRPDKRRAPLQETWSARPEDWRGQLKNDFEEVVFKKYPVIASIKDFLYQQGAIYASMSGSGAAVYGIFPGEVQLPGLGLNERIYYLAG